VAPATRAAPEAGSALDRLRRRAVERALAGTAQLPLWPEAVRGLPNGVLRSALFGVVPKGGGRRYLERERLASLEGVTIHYTGQRLDQGDLDLWATVLHLARIQALGAQCRFTAYALLRWLGKADTGENRRILHRRLLRLMANSVELTQGRFTYLGSLVEEAYRDAATQAYSVVLNARLGPLFELDQFTHVDWAVRRALDGKQLAKWLHGFYATHARPFPITVGALLALSGSANSAPRSRRQKLGAALAAVAEACAQNGQVFRAELRGDLVHVERAASTRARQHPPEPGAEPKLSTEGPVTGGRIPS
jgi:hypothetical protein